MTRLIIMMPMNTRTPSLRPWLAAATLATGCAGSADPEALEPVGHNVILISIDTLRPDHLGCYGYDRPTSPRVDQLRADGILFRQAIAHAPSTLPSHASILTSLVPQHHGASFASRTGLPGEALTLAEVLSAAGYATRSWNGGGQVSAEFGLDQGFDHYASLRSDRFYDIVKRANAWLDAERTEPFFLFLHSYEVHATYHPGRRYREMFEGDYDGPLPDRVTQDLLNAINQGEVAVDDRDVQHIIDLYDAEIRSMNDGLGHLLGKLKERGLYDDTMIVFTSDHGEEFAEHGKIGLHSHTLYDELLHVPLLVKLPGNRLAGATVESSVRSIDIAPTILEAVGLPIPDVFSGANLVAAEPGERQDGRVAISWRDLTSPARVESIRTDRWKLYHGQLYDMAADPGETHDMAAELPDQVSQLDQRLASMLAEHEPFVGSQTVLDDELRRQLEALGYLGDSPSTDEKPPVHD